jgi:hypothetical protein
MEVSMKLPEYITTDEVRKVCHELGLRDWTALSVPDVMQDEAKVILKEVNIEMMPINVEAFRMGLEVELEHGLRFHDANVTNNHPVITGMIVLAHMKESLDYYYLLDVAEAEGDLSKAIAGANMEKTRKYYKKLTDAKRILAEVQMKQL